MTALAALREEMPDIQELVLGENFSDRADGHSHVVSMGFADRAALAAFYDHPAHKTVAANVLKPITADLLLIDYEERNA